MLRRSVTRQWLARLEGIDRAMTVAAAALVATSVATLGLLGFHVHFIAPGLDLVIDTVTTIVTLSVAALAWARFGERGERIAIFQAAAFLVSAMANGFSMLLVLDEVQALPGVALIAPGEGTLWISTFARLTMATVLVAGGATSARRVAARHPVATLAAPALLVLAAAVLVHILGDTLPPLSDTFAIPGAAGAAGGAPLPNSTPFGSIVQVAGGVLFVAAALVSRRLYLREHHTADAYLAVGLIFGAFSQFHLAFYPGTYAGLVTSGDLLRLAFDMVLLLGIEAEARATLVVLRTANTTLERLRGAEADKAALEERARLSRELHDGLAQDLWLAKLKTARLGVLPGLGPEGTALCAELESAIDSGLAEARQAVLALRMGGQPSDAPLSELLGRYVDDFADRFGLRATFETDDAIPRLGHRAEAELLRIVQESLSNVRRHADATLARVAMTVANGDVVVTIRDNGKGFDPSAMPESGFGLASMKERADLIHGRLVIESRPSDGTRVSISVPVPPAASLLSPLVAE